MSNEQFLQGIHNIEASIITGLQKAGISTNPVFTWHRGKNLIPIPSIPIHLAITNGNKEFELQFEREEIDDSWDVNGHWPNTTQQKIRILIQKIAGS